MRKFLGTMALFSMVAAAAPSIVRAETSNAASASDLPATFSTSRLVVEHSPLTRLNGNVLSKAAGRRMDRLSTSTAARTVVGLGAHLSGQELQDAIEAIEDLPGVLRVTPSIRMHPLVSPNDPYFDDQDHLQKFSEFFGAANLENAWAAGTGSSDTVIAIIDTGYTDHEDLSDSRIVAEADMIAADAPGYYLTANDGDGRDSDAHDPGDWVNSDDQQTEFFAPEYCELSTSSWHGTHVTGIAAASTNNNLGVAGVNWSAKLVQVRALGKCGGYSDDIADGIRWAAGGTVPGISGTNPYPADVINMSLGGYAPDGCDSYTQSAIDFAVSRGTTVVVAAGNEDMNAADVNPANCNNVIVVGATDSAGNKSSFSNYGSAVDIAAPGVDILSTLNSGLEEPSADDDFYNFLSGTSMASPVVAGVVSLMLAARPALTPAQVEQQLKDTARDFGSSPGVALGAGLVDAFAAVDGTLPASNMRVSVDKNNLKIIFNKSSNASRYIVKRVFKGKTSTLTSSLSASLSSYTDKNRATVTGTHRYTVIAVQSDGTRSRAATTSFRVVIPPKPVISASPRSKRISVRASFPTSSPSVRTWCVYVDGRLKKCSSASTKTKTISSTSGNHSVFVRSSTLKGTSGKSNAVIVRVS